MMWTSVGEYWNMTFLLRNFAKDQKQKQKQKIKGQSTVIRKLLSYDGNLALHH